MYAESPRLPHCPPGLPRRAYLEDGWFSQEMRSVFARNWVMAGRLADLPPGSLRRVMVGEAPVILARQPDGALSAFHNACRHRGAELCPEGADRALGRLITCPYHAWSFAAADGRLVSTAHAMPTADFRPQDHGLRPVAHRIWNGFVLLCLSTDPRPLRADVPLSTLDTWPMDALVTGHRWQATVACNWKVFWENYSECLHCPGIHPELCDRVPVYGTGLMAAAEAAGWTPGTPAGPNLSPGAESWTPSGARCGPAFPALTPAQRQAGHTFVTLWPTAYVVAHVDHVRAVRVEPLTATTTRLVAEWLFPAETLAQPGFDAASVAAFARRVMEQDGAASEMNQRGLAGPSFTQATLMPEEYEIHRFHQWLMTEMEAAP